MTLTSGSVGPNTHDYISVKNIEYLRVDVYVLKNYLQELNNAVEIMQSFGSKST